MNCTEVTLCNMSDCYSDFVCKTLSDTNLYEGHFINSDFLKTTLLDNKKIPLQITKLSYQITIDIVFRI